MTLTLREEMAPPSVPNWERLQLELIAEARAEVDRALAVAVLLQAGRTQTEIRDRLGLGPDELKGSIKRLRRISERLEREELPEEFEGGTTL